MSRYTLLNADSIQAKAGTGGGAINFTVSSGDEITSGTEVFKILAQGQLTTSVVSLYSPGSSTKTGIIQQVVFYNTTASAVSLSVYVNGTAAGNQETGGTIPANGSAFLNKDGIKFLDANGALVTTMPLVATGDATGTASGGVLPLTLVTVNSSPGTSGSASTTNTITVNAKGLTTAVTNNPIAITNTQVSGLGTSSTKNTGISVVDPGTGALESVTPVQTQLSTTSKVYAVGDLQKWFSRVNGGVAMTDTLPVMSAARDGEYIIISNDDTSASITIGAGAGQTFVSAAGVAGAASFTMFAGRRTQFVWNNAGAFWRLLSNNNNLTKGKSGTTFTLGNIPVISTNTNGNEIDDSGIVATSIYRAGGTDVAITDGGTGVSSLPSGILKGAGTGAITAAVAADVPVVAAGGTGALSATDASVTNARTPTGSINTTAPLTGGAALSTSPTIAVSDATFTTRGTMTAQDKVEQNTDRGRTSTGTNPRVFKPGDYMQGNVHDPTGASISTSFAAMMTAARAWNDRYEIELAAGVWKIPHDTLKDFGTNNTSVTIRGPGRGNCILLPSAAPTGFQSMIAPNRNTTGGDSITMRGFTIYNTSGTVYTTGAGILTNGADGIDIQEVAFIDMYRDIQVSGEPHTMTTNGTTALTGITPAISAADTGQTISGPGIVPGSTITFLTSSTATLSVAATTSTSEVRYLNNTIKVSMQHTVHFNTNAGAANTSVAVYVNNGQAGDTYIGPDVVMSDGGGSTRRRACVELVETGHYEITQANLTGSQYGILMDPGASQSVAFGFHTNVLCDSNQINGMLLDTLATTSSIKNIKSVNSWYSGTVNAAAPFNVGAAGVKTQATAAGTLNGFTHTTDRFLNNRTHGYEHAAGTDFRWSDCDMKGNSQIGSNTADGLNVAANIGNWSINGGKFGGGDASPTSGNQRYGINVAAGTGDNIKVGPDSLTGNVTGPLLFAATGLNNFINGCPGLYTGFTRGATTTTVAATAKTVGSTFVPKGSLSVRSAWRVTVTYQHIGIGTVPTISVRFGTTNDVVDTTATNAIIGSLVAASGAANVWGQAYFMLEINQTGAGTGIIGAGGFLVQAALVTAFATAARANGAGMLNNINTTVDNYLTVSATTTATAGLTILGATIEPVAF